MEMKQYLLEELFEKPISGEWGNEIEEGLNGVKVIRTTNFTNKGILDFKKEVVIRAIDIYKYENKILKQGDIIIEKSGGSPNQPVGRSVLFNETNGIYFCNNFTSILRPVYGFDSKYLLYMLMNLYSQRRVLKFQNKTTGIINLKLNDYLEATKVNIPSLEIQQKIATILDKAQSLIDKRKEQIEACDELVKSLFYDMFGDPILNNNKWDIVKVIDVCECMVPGRDKPKSFTGEIPWITIDDLIVSGLTLKSKKEMGLTREEVSEVKRKTIPVGSVIMSCVGNLGITSVAGIEMVINQQLHSFQCGEKINNHFLAYVLPYYKSNMEKVATSTTVLYMNKTACNNIEIILPPLSLQNKFAARVEKIQQQKNLLEQSLKELENNFNSLMQRAFKGELF